MALRCVGPGFEVAIGEWQQPGDHAQQRRLARPIGTDVPEDRARLDRLGQAVDARSRPGRPGSRPARCAHAVEEAGGGQPEHVPPIATAMVERPLRLPDGCRRGGGLKAQRRWPGPMAGGGVFLAWLLPVLATAAVLGWRAWVARPRDLGDRLGWLDAALDVRDEVGLPWLGLAVGPVLLAPFLPFGLWPWLLIAQAVGVGVPTLRAGWPDVPLLRGVMVASVVLGAGLASFIPASNPDGLPTDCTEFEHAEDGAVFLPAAEVTLVGGGGSCGVLSVVTSGTTRLPGTPSPWMMEGTAAAMAAALGIDEERLDSSVALYLGGAPVLGDPDQWTMSELSVPERRDYGGRTVLVERRGVTFDRLPDRMLVEILIVYDAHFGGELHTLTVAHAQGTGDDPWAEDLVNGWLDVRGR